MTKVSINQIEFCGTDDIMFRRGRRSVYSRVISPSMTKNYVRTCYEKRKREAVESHITDNVSIAKSDGK